jgi:hypothetical protein
MGMMTALDLKEQRMSLEQQLAIHFSSNCYPPIPKIMIPVAVAAIHAYWDEDYTKVIPLPEGVEHRATNSTSIFASQAVESLRLDAWVMEEDDYDE